MIHGKVLYTRRRKNTVRPFGSIIRVEFLFTLVYRDSSTPAIYLLRGHLGADDPARCLVAGQTLCSGGKKAVLRLIRVDWSCTACWRSVSCRFHGFHCVSVVFVVGAFYWNWFSLFERLCIAYRKGKELASLNSCESVNYLRRIERIICEIQKEEDSSVLFNAGSILLITCSFRHLLDRKYFVVHTHLGWIYIKLWS